MRSGVKSIRNVEPVVGLVICHISLRDGNEFFFDFSTKLKSSFDLLVRIIGLDCGADNRNIVALLANRMNG